MLLVVSACKLSVQIMVVYVGNFIFYWFIVFNLSEVAVELVGPSCLLAKNYWGAADT